MSSAAKPSPAEQAPTPGQRTPPAGRKFPCPKCGAKLDFDPTSRALLCPYCGNKEVIEPATKEVRERDWEEFWNNRGGGETTIAGHSCQVTCPGCGAVVLLDDKVATDRCPYCTTHLENEPQAAQEMIPPEGVLPFAVTQKDAARAFNDWLASLWFAPNSLRRLANLGRLTGMYVPYWTYDSMTYTHYTGERGDDYTETETYTVTNEKGETETKQRQVTKTRWWPVSGEVQHFFDDVLVCASRSLPEGHVRQLTPWDLDKLEGFKPDFLSGFQTERYAVGLKDGFEEARQIMDGHIRQLCCRDIGGDHQRLHSVSTQHVGVTFKHILLPVWVAAYRYQNQPYQILVNARTGEVVGSRPYSWAKITLLVMAILLALAVAFLIYSGTARGGTGSVPPRPPTRSVPMRTGILAGPQPRLPGTTRVTRPAYSQGVAGVEGTPCEYAGGATRTPRPAGAEERLAWDRTARPPLVSALFDPWFSSSSLGPGPCDRSPLIPGPRA